MPVIVFYPKEHKQENRKEHEVTLIIANIVAYLASVVFLRLIKKQFLPDLLLQQQCCACIGE